MSQYVVKGGKRLEGEVTIGVSKNAILPIMAATLLCESITYLKNCPKILDVDIMIEILKELGCQVAGEGHDLMIDPSQVTACEINKALVKKMRSSIMLLGALLGRIKEAKIGQPGGCQLGARPINLHLEALRKMGTVITEEDDIICCKALNLQGATIHLSFPSVGATENIMLAAAKSEGETVIYHPAKEPEIVDLQDFLVACGAKIKGAGTDKITIQGVKHLNGITYEAIPDRIIAGTYLAAGAITRGRILLKNVNNNHLRAQIEAFRQMGCHLTTTKDTILLEASDTLSGLSITTAPYPGYPTDMQSQMMALLCTCNTKSYIEEKLFESRFKIVEELRKMGAHIEAKEQYAVIYPNTPLVGQTVTAMDLRGGAALVVAGLGASGITKVNTIHHIQRGYESIVTDLRCLGAEITEEE